MIIITVLTLASLVFLTYHYLQYLKVKSSSPGYGKTKFARFLFLGFIAVIGISNIFAEAVFELLQLKKPENLEWQAFAAYAVMAIAYAIMFRPVNEQTGDAVDFGTSNVVNYKNTIDTQVNHLGGGNKGGK